MASQELDGLYSITVQSPCKKPTILDPLWWCQGTWWKTARQPRGWYKGNKTDLTTLLGPFHVDAFPPFPVQPQELNIMGTLRSYLCSTLNFTAAWFSNTAGFHVSPSRVVFRNCTWCNTNVSRQIITRINALSLPDGIFLVSGDRAWKAIPGRGMGGLCAFSRLKLFYPSVALHKLTHQLSHCMKQAVTSFPEDCDFNVHFWSSDERVLASLLAPIGTAQVLSTLNKLGFQLAKESNATSTALRSLLMDVDSVWHATLLNREAINFLLLAQGH